MRNTKSIMLLALLILVSMSSMSIAKAPISAQKQPVNDVITYPKVAPFDWQRKRFVCKTSQTPASEEKVNRWYKAALTSYLKNRSKSTLDYQQIIILMEAAARKGHVRAAEYLYALYSDNNLNPEDPNDEDFLVDAKKSRYWLDEGLKQNWPEAFEWLSASFLEGSNGFAKDGDLALDYLQHAAEMGSASAQYEMGMAYKNSNPRLAREYIQCARQQNNGLALLYLLPSDTPDMRLVNLQQTLTVNNMQGNSAALAVMFLGNSFGNDKPFPGRLPVKKDLARYAAYNEIRDAIEDNTSNRGSLFLSFDKINKVLPLPPAKMPPWQGIYSSMSDEDARFHQHPPKIADLLAEIDAEGLIPPASYLPQKKTWIHRILPKKP